MAWYIVAAPAVLPIMLSSSRRLNEETPASFVISTPQSKFPPRLGSTVITGEHVHRLSIWPGQGQAVPSSAGMASGSRIGGPPVEKWAMFAHPWASGFPHGLHLIDAAPHDAITNTTRCWTRKNHRTEAYNHFAGLSSSCCFAGEPRAPISALYNRCVTSITAL